LYFVPPTVTKKVVGVFVRFSCALQQSGMEITLQNGCTEI
jgi:hypothetical protein